MVISSRHTLQSLNNYTMNIHIDGVPINQSNQSKTLGLTIDENLSWKAHIHDIFKQVSSGTHALKWVRQFVSMHTAINIYSGLNEPNVDYCSAVWDVAKSQEKRKQTKVKAKRKQLKLCFRPELNWRPSACQADVITTTLRKPL